MADSSTGTDVPQIVRYVCMKNISIKNQIDVKPSGICRLNFGPLKRKRPTEQDSAPFRYSEMPGPDQIRLLHLEPASGNPSVLKGSLRIHKLDEKCEYEAISYAWGDLPWFDQAIVLDGQVLKITGNLYAALMAYSHADCTRVLWVDAICINQSDTEEKSRQVSMMADIFKKAKTVQTWLGLDAGGTTKALDFMASISAMAEKKWGASHETLDPPVVEKRPYVTLPEQAARDLVHLAVDHHVDYLLSSSWFNRVWIVQEVALASELAVSCGHSTLDWNAFARTLGLLSEAVPQLPNEEGRLRLKGLVQAFHLVLHRDTFVALDQVGYSPVHFHLNSSLMRTSKRECSNDRDRVYAMLAMTISKFSMMPDYTKTVAEVYREYASTFSPETQIYNAGLCYRPLDTHPPLVNSAAEEDQPSLDLANRDYLPSWAPEYRPLRNSSWGTPLGDSYRAAPTPPFIHPHPTIPSVLFASGGVLDYIYMSSQILQGRKVPECIYDADYFFTIIQQLNLLLLTHSTHISRHTGEPLWLMLAKTLTVGTGTFPGAENQLLSVPMFQCLPDALTPGTILWLTKLWKCFETHCLAPTGEVYQVVLLHALGAKPRHNISDDALVATGFMNYIANIFATNRLVVTKKGLLGLVPWAVRGGDYIALLNGGQTPLVLRRAPKAVFGEEGLDGACLIVGPCYVHGVMGGEVFGEGAVVDLFGHLTWEGEGEGRRLDGWVMLV
ncbi:HET-domain-containing protein [Pyrenochaeta sp. DS3sAY3a]|nr:HET-domain-containing protein [Pyrenochaeta sp. DS3sAY3a]